ncbi:SLC24A1, partial [Symbiodinium microadriaticum]
MFWGLALVCEEYFVPALNIMCEEANIPDDVAGATFMAAGASSPEMFTSFIALFVNHSAIGVGTVVGSEIFNHMIICAGSVMYSSTGVLQLEKRVFSRDVVAYFVCLI